jgi:hypothetical protein
MDPNPPWAVLARPGPWQIHSITSSNHKPDGPISGIRLSDTRKQDLAGEISKHSIP